MEIPDGTKITPMLEQYLHWKKKYPDCLLFFRMGDFYEMFFEDARTAASVLDIVLTSRSKESDNAIPMAGVPFHSVDSYLDRLVAAGYRVAICEQMTEPDGKTLVRREVTRIVTPGTWLPENSESEGHLAACEIDGKDMSIALLLTATGALHAGTFPIDQAMACLTSFRPDEVILCKGQAEIFKKITSLFIKANVVERDRGEFNAASGSRWLCTKWGIATLGSMGMSDGDPAVGAACAALKYLEETQFSKAAHVQCVTPILPSKNMVLDQSTRTNLELTEPAGTSLFSVLNRCRTPMGKRLLKEWIISPLQDIDEINRREEAVGSLVDDRHFASSLADELACCRDMARSISRLTLKMGAPGDLGAIRDTLDILPHVIETVKGTELEKWSDVPDLGALRGILDSSLADDLPRMLRDGGVIKRGWNEELDKWKDMAANSSSWLRDYEERERARTGIKTLKTGVNKVFGYYIEVSNGSLDRVPPEYVRKQTLVNGERFITEELKKFENGMFSAEDEITALEAKLYEKIMSETFSRSADIQKADSFLAAADVLLSLADVASDRRYVRPQMDLGTDFIVRGGRHPVIEVALGRQPFTPNDIDFSSGKGRRIAIITGPNMAGKSTYLRMAALIAIMAHMGSYVPAESARIGIIDRVFTRIGARDELARGQSTFMVEMVETANILRHATDKSLVVLDEVGRGTSTYDGLSIAWAVVEYLHGQETRQARVLFATHYHELTKLAGVLPGVVNLSMAVEESENGIVFLHKVVEAPADRSYGIEVAKLAGVPSTVLRRSKELLEQFEDEASKRGEIKESDEPNQMTLFDMKQEAVLEELAACDPDGMTPMEALQLLYRLREESRKALKLP